jgi:Fic family protein
MKFLDGLSDNLKKTLLEELRVLWTHASTAIEGNTLTLGETAFVLSEGLTVKGKPLKDHKDVEGHAHAVDLLLGLMKKEVFTAEDLFDLHKLVMNEQIFDFYKPIGNWKKENNYTSIALGDNPTILQFSDHREVPRLMARWLDLLNTEFVTSKTPEESLTAFARLHISFVGIHPFWDGNGRVARLVSNLPCLKAGYPPIIIEKERRYDYITILSEYHIAHGVPTTQVGVIHENASFKKFEAFCGECWAKSRELVEQAHVLQHSGDIIYS